MPREWYVIIGLAKTGTTAVAMTLRNTLRIAPFAMEPRDLAAIKAERHERLVIKFLFDHWLERADQLKDFLCGEAGDRGPCTIAIVRDPRDEAISRLHYLAYDYFATRPTSDVDRADWLDIFRRKEAQPGAFGLIAMQDELKRRFGVGFLADKSVYESFHRFVDEMTERRASPFYVLRYEDFVGNTMPDEVLRKLLSGSRSVSPELRRVLRSGSSGDWRHFLVDSDVAALDELCGPFLRRFGYVSERTAPPETLSPLTGSDYVDRLISEALIAYKERQQSG